MPDSLLTKKALASAFKQLLQEKPFSKISIGDICNACGMNRKSFYYHFKDKYDLVNWIFYTDFIVKVYEKEHVDEWELLTDLCDFFYENKEFYRITFGVEGQNCFSEYFRDLIATILQTHLKDKFEQGKMLDFYIDFYADAFFCAIKRWMLLNNDMDQYEFCSLLKKCLFTSTKNFLENIE